MRVGTASCSLICSLDSLGNVPIYSDDEDKEEEDKKREEEEEEEEDCSGKEESEDEKDMCNVDRIVGEMPKENKVEHQVEWEREELKGQFTWELPSVLASCCALHEYLQQKTLDKSGSRQEGRCLPSADHESCETRAGLL